MGPRPDERIGEKQWKTILDMMNGDANEDVKKKEDENEDVKKDEGNVNINKILHAVGL